MNSNNELVSATDTKVKKRRLETPTATKESLKKEKKARLQGSRDAKRTDADIDVKMEEKKKERKQKKKKKEKKRKNKKKSKKRSELVAEEEKFLGSNEEKKVRSSEDEAAARQRDEKEGDLVTHQEKRRIVVEDDTPSGKKTEDKAPTQQHDDHRIVQSSALDFVPAQNVSENDTSLLLFYQYVEPAWDTEFYNRTVLVHMNKLGADLELTGRMRVAREGLNCTLTGSHDSILSYCRHLRKFHQGEFAATEFKITKDLPRAQRFPNLKVIPVTELVHYGLEGEKTPSIAYTGNHLEPVEYHKKLAEEGTVVIDVRNHYEAAIGHFEPPAEGAEWLDPEMRKSTEFPVWLNKPETKEKLRGKQVLMYCTGGVRCERASALLNYKIETEPDVKDLGIKGIYSVYTPVSWSYWKLDSLAEASIALGVYQLQGGIDKYFKEIPDGGFWKGKNYVFDKRFAHAPPKIEAEERVQKSKSEQRMGNCEACGKPWDMYRGKRRCPTCGVPSLICRDCFQAHRDGTKRIGRDVRCDLCVQQNISSKAQIREREEKELQEYESARSKIAAGVAVPKSMQALVPNPNGVTRLLLKNMCRRKMDDATLMEALPGITHIVWRTDRRTGQFYGSGWVEMASAEDAARAVGMNGLRVLGRPMQIMYDPPDTKDSWPPPKSAVARY